jgi:hypothetical protein
LLADGAQEFGRKPKFGKLHEMIPEADRLQSNRNSVRAVTSLG